MKVSHTLICFFLTLGHGNTGFTNSEIPVLRATEGGNITVLCTFTFSGGPRTFCKDDCKGRNILIATDQDTAQRGRYSMKYQEGTFPFSSTLLYVNITNLTKSDSGRYKCSVDGLFSTSSKHVEIRVDAPVASKPTSVPPASTTTTTTQSLSSGSGGSTPPSASSETTKHSQQQEEDNERTPAAGSGMLLYVCLTLGVMIVALSAAVLIFCRKRASKPKDAPVQSEYANITEVSREYEEIREDGWSRSPPVEISTVYTCSTNSEATDKVSFATADSSQKKTQDISSKVIYAEVDFSNRAAASTNSAPRGDAVNVVYSVPRVDASAPLYSTLTLV